MLFRSNLSCEVAISELRKKDFLKANLAERPAKNPEQTETEQKSTSVDRWPMVEDGSENGMEEES